MGGPASSSSPGVFSQKDQMLVAAGHQDREFKRDSSSSASDSDGERRPAYTACDRGAQPFQQGAVPEGTQSDARTLHHFAKLEPPTDRPVANATPAEDNFPGVSNGLQAFADDAGDEPEHAHPARRGRRSLPRTGLRHPCKVPGCEWSFKRYEHLKRHMMTHSGERPFACAFPGCHKSFGRSDNFTAHVRTHEANRRKSSVSGLDVGSHKRPAAETSEELKRFKVTDDDSSANSPFSDASDNGSRSVSPAQLSPTAKCCSIQMMLNDAAVPEQTRTSLTEIDGPPERTSPTQQAAERSDEEKKNSAAILLASMRTSSSSAARASSAQDRRASYLGAQFTYPTIPQQGAQPVFVLPPPATQFQFQHPQSGMVIAGGAFPPGSFVVPLAHVPHQSQAPMEPAVVPLNNRPRSRTLPTMPNLLVLPAQLAPCPPYAVPAVPPGPFRTADALKAENDPAVAGRHLAGAGSGASGTEGDEADAPASKPHCCHHPGCARRFKRREHLRRHLRTHTSEKPFECPVCHKNFSRNDNLTQHIRIHRGSRSQQRNFEAENDDGDPAGSPAATAVAAAVPSSPISDDQLSDPSASAPSSPITDAGAAASSPPPKAASGMGGRGASA